MSNNFQKPHVYCSGILDPKPGKPNGYVTNDGMWAAIPYKKNFIIVNNGKQVHLSKNYDSAVSYIKKQIKMINTKNRKS